MKKKYKFRAHMHCRCSEVEEIVEIDVTGCITKSAESIVVQHAYEEWLDKYIDKSFEEVFEQN